MCWFSHFLFAFIYELGKSQFTSVAYCNFQEPLILFQTCGPVGWVMRDPVYIVCAAIKALGDKHDPLGFCFSTRDVLGFICEGCHLCNSQTLTQPQLPPQPPWLLLSRSQEDWKTEPGTSWFWCEKLFSLVLKGWVMFFKAVKLIPDLFMAVRATDVFLELWYYT